MKELLKLRLQRLLSLIVTVATISVITSCSEANDDSDTVTKGDMILEAIAGTHSIGTEGLPSGVQVLINNPMITITTSGSGATWSVDDKSGLDTYLIGGDFLVGKDGTVSDATVIPAQSTDLSISNTSVSASETQVVIAFEVEQKSESGRVDGLGMWEITVNIN